VVPAICPVRTRLSRTCGAHLRYDVPLAPRTSYGLGGPARFFHEPGSVEELGEFLQCCSAAGLPVKVLGGGSNILVPDDGFRGGVVSLSAPAFRGVHACGNRITAGAGVRISRLIAAAVRAGVAGPERLGGVPGTVGGAVRGNAGTRLGDIGRLVSAVITMSTDGVPKRREARDLRFGYRESDLGGEIVLGCELMGPFMDRKLLRRSMRDLYREKIGSQPYGTRNAGCVFKNPSGMSAGWIIEQAGLKGFSVRGAEVSVRHANFILARAGARAADVVELIDRITESVLRQFGVLLRPEIDIW
jgi:UDP-N-acetylmuramate dehydrogenase